MRVLIAGGGTGGHVIPALAIARELRDAHGAEVRFVGTARGLETRLVPEAGFALELIKVGQLKNVSLMTRVRTFADLPLGLLRCAGLLRSFKPDVVVGVGGYASGPAMMAAILLRVPTLAFEPNAVPGLANRLVGRLVGAAAVNFAATTSYFRRAEVTGIPVRKEFFALAPKQAGALRLLVFGGSQGAQVLNRVMPSVASGLLEQFPALEIVHQAGGRHGETTAEAFRSAGVVSERVRVVPYLDGMVEEIGGADLIVCRSGASTVAELAAAGRASVLVPFAAAADDHQRKNADVLVEAGAAVMVLESELNPERLGAVVADLLEDSARRSRMGEAARGLAHADAAGQIARMCLRLARP
ncbi:undecaprenyldiphospho-muramoylpentapeptide beta-N-acetylglucosaminyltransferase [Granulicella sp. WH15]|uniref:undecaprenyldiphospho-muramoylpentapeptide beta-N-acetylglucosaminyltransferase n=1 Tax=Granulicella sp. WH15 TaxID=2602070 RepID=UPI001366BC48|nr:undecaprenyldiphospho-muramoylpentapeptide beta-N-acetylglucosaminyltransferase [Granulicella sp. WH15]QHN04452.1 undecaprenyldiphospho-muramoylpentapeptide beta-N-acetylglucosaminyltransferase [Granulicella sp. WH15]